MVSCPVLYMCQILSFVVFLFVVCLSSLLFFVSFVRLVIVDHLFSSSFMDPLHNLLQLFVTGTHGIFSFFLRPLSVSFFLVFCFFYSLSSSWYTPQYDHCSEVDNDAYCACTHDFSLCTHVKFGPVCTMYAVKIGGTRTIF